MPLPLFIRYENLILCIIILQTELFFLTGDQIIGHFKQEHQAPTNGTGESDAYDTEFWCQNSGTGGAGSGLQEGADDGGIHFAHAPVKTLHAVGHGGEQIE